MDTIDNSIMIYMKNERGVAVPIFVRITDRVRVLLMEAASIRAIHRGSLAGKAFFHKERRLNADDVIGELGIAYYDTVRLQTINDLTAGTENASVDGHNITTIDHGPID
ncbi:hypothetical protein DICVIV_04739 [Dictyocaulus viviparus]|uniref:Uncharacterized protein n=1 Tax=Dictyocaulus viviparus TaxID=29172 RepID=A0A0D8XZB0_DICVI|nr:hypothetical protein DICVIV_04739 [Dictyocaulus viviparus]